MSTELGNVNDISATRFWGGEERGVCLQLTSKDGYVQASAAELVAIIPAIKSVIDMELERRKRDCEKAIADHKDLEKTIVNDMRAVAEMALNQPILDMASLLNLGGLKLEGGEK